MPNRFSHSPEPLTKEMTIKVGLGSTNRITLYAPRTTVKTRHLLFISMAFGHVTASRLAIQLGYKERKWLSRDRYTKSHSSQKTGSPSGCTQPYKVKGPR